MSPNTNVSSAQKTATEQPKPASSVLTGNSLSGDTLLFSERYVVTESMIAEPDKVMRIGRMIARLLDEVKEAPLDEASRLRMREIYDQSIESLAGVLEDRLALELIRITTPFAEDSTPSESELRIAQAQLVGWLEGLFQGMQTALLARHLQTTMGENTKPSIPTSLALQGQSTPGTYL